METQLPRQDGEEIEDLDTPITRKEINDQNQKINNQCISNQNTSKENPRTRDGFTRGLC